MTNVGEAWVTILPSFRGGARAIERELDGAAASAGTSASRSFGGVFATGMTTAVVGGAVAIAGLGVAGLKAGIETAAGMENAKIAFTTMLGSAEKADSFLRDLGKFAAETPFEFPELQTAASSLISIGIDSSKVIPIMRTLGDVTSGMGTGSEGVKRATVALQQMNAAGRITAEDLNQLRDAGVPVYDLLAAATGKSKEEVAGLAQAGKLGKTELTQLMSALESGKGLERFAGLMDKQSQSMSGLWSTLKDGVNMGLATAIQPLIPIIKDGLGGAIAAVSRGAPLLAAGLKAVVDAGVGIVRGLGPAVDVVKLLVGSFTGAGADVPITSWTNDIIDLGAAARAAFDGFSAALLPALSAIGSGITTSILPALRELGSTVGPKLGAILVPALSAIGSVITGTVLPAITRMAPVMLGALGSLISLVTTVVSAVLTALAPFVPTIVEIIGTVGQIIGTGVEVIVTAFSLAVSALRMIWDSWGSTIVGTVTTVFGVALGVIQGAVGLIRAVITTVLALIRGDWSGAWDGLKSIVSSALGLIGTAIGGALTLIKTAFSLAWQAIVALVRLSWDNLVSIVRTQVSLTVNLLSSAWSALGGLASQAWAAVTSAVSSAWESAKSAVSTGIGAVAALMAGLPGRITSAIGDLGRLLWDAGSRVIQGLIDGVSSKLGDLRDKLGEVTSLIPSWKGPPQRDATLLTANGRLIMGGLIDGLESRYADVRASLGGLTGSLAVGTPSAGVASAHPAGGVAVHVHPSPAMDERTLARMVVQAVDVHYGGR